MTTGSPRILGDLQCQLSAMQWRPHEGLHHAQNSFAGTIVSVDRMRWLILAENYGGDSGERPPSRRTPRRSHPRADRGALSRSDSVTVQRPLHN